MASTDDADTNAKFARKNEADFPILSDPDKTVADAFGVLATAGYASRVTFYIDPQGSIAYTDVDVNPSSAGADLASRLNLLGVPANQEN